VFAFKLALPIAVFEAPVVFEPNEPCPTAVLSFAVVVTSKAFPPIAVFLCPEVNAVKASLPIAVLFPPVTAASKAFSPRTVLPATEFAPLPISIELKDPSVEKVEEILVRFDPFIAGKVAGNLASGIVPEVKLDALKAVKSIAAQLRFPEASVFNQHYEVVI